MEFKAMILKKQSTQLWNHKLLEKPKYSWLWILILYSQDSEPHKIENNINLLHAFIIKYYFPDWLPYFKN